MGGMGFGCRECALRTDGFRILLDAENAAEYREHGNSNLQCVETSGADAFSGLPGITVRQNCCGKKISVTVLTHVPDVEYNRCQCLNGIGKAGQENCVPGDGEFNDKKEGRESTV